MGMLSGFEEVVLMMQDCIAVVTHAAGLVCSIYGVTEALGAGGSPRTTPVS